MPPKGVGFPDPLSATLKNFIENGKYTVSVSKNFLISMEMQMFNVVLRTLFARRWCLLISSGDQGELITCDDPVVLRFNGPKGKLITRGFGMPNVDIIFPLTKNICLLDYFEDNTISRQISAIEVAALNTDIYLDAERQVYASSEVFYIFDPATMMPKLGKDLILGASKMEGHSGGTGST